MMPNNPTCDSMYIPSVLVTWKFVCVFSSRNETSFFFAFKFAQCVVGGRGEVSISYHLISRVEREEDGWMDDPSLVSYPRVVYKTSIYRSI